MVQRLSGLWMIKDCWNWCVTLRWLKLRTILFIAKLLKNYRNSLGLFTLGRTTSIKSMISLYLCFNHMWMVRLHLRFTLIIIFFNIGVFFFSLLMILVQCVLNKRNMELHFLVSLPLHLALLVSKFCLIFSCSLCNLHFIVFNLHIIVHPLVQISMSQLHWLVLE